MYPMFFPGGPPRHYWVLLKDLDALIYSPAPKIWYHGMMALIQFFTYDIIFIYAGVRNQFILLVLIGIDLVGMCFSVNGIFEI